MNEIVCLDPAFSTTRCVMRLSANEPANWGSEFLQQLPPNSLRKGEGGLRMRGCFKANEVGENENDAPLITVITAVFNGEKTLENAILSVISQSYSNVEYIVIDGGSTDGSIDIIKRYEHAIDYWISEPDTGIYDAWNKGVSVAGGRWIAFLGADDIYLEGAIQAYAGLINEQQDGNLDFVSSKVNLIKNNAVLSTVGTQWCWKTLRKYMKIAHVGAMHHRSLFERYGLFDVTYKIGGDYEFLLRPGANLRADFLDAATVDMEIGGASDANILVFQEAVRAKTSTANRNFLLSYLEKYWAIFKWKIRNLLRD